MDTENSFHRKILNHYSLFLHPGAILFSLQKFGLPDPSLLKGIMKNILFDVFFDASNV